MGLPASSSWRWTTPTPVNFTFLAAVAEREREAIPERTEAALAAAKARGKQLDIAHGLAPLRQSLRGP
jgi:DNA invertase Pin-like site-specific DNA recombinase